MTNSSTDESYYYAEGQKVRLVKADDYFAIDLELVADEELKSRLQSLGKQLRRTFYLLERKNLSDTEIEKLTECKALRPVFRHEDHLVIVLPEIRMLEIRTDVRQKLPDWLNEQQEKGEIIKAIGNRISLRPKSQSSAETLSLAIKLHEELGVKVAEPRMMQLIDR